MSISSQPSVRCGTTEKQPTAQTVEANETSSILPALCQLHLDFHTSAAIAGVGADFDADRFGDQLLEAGIGSVTLFAKCHHSMCYYPTCLGQAHPGLPRDAEGMPMDLLGQQIEACRRRGIRCPVYFTVGWSQADAERRPDWVVRNHRGEPTLSGGARFEQIQDSKMPRPMVTWSFLDVGDGSPTSYGQYLLDMLAEVCDRYDLDGLFLDICVPKPNYAGLTLSEHEIADQQEHVLFQAAKQRWLNWAQRVQYLLHEKHPGASLFFNGLAKIDTPDTFLELQSHLEIEDLPSFWNGYDCLPIRTRYLRSRAVVGNKAMVAMSGRFHTMWGEFGGYKHPDAMRIEALSMVANGCRCSFGDQLPPCGVLDQEGLDRLRPAMLAVQSFESYLVDADFDSALGICRPNTSDEPIRSQVDNDLQGLGEMLLELHREFVFTTPSVLSDVSNRLKTLIVLETLNNPTALNRLATFVRNGGQLMLVGPEAISSAIRGGLDCGITMVDRPSFDVDYLQPGTALDPTTVNRYTSSIQPVLCYEPAIALKLAGATPLAEAVDPYFSRTNAQFCSHRHTPPDPSATLRPAITTHQLGAGHVFCLAHAWGRMYHQWGMRLHRDLFGLVLAQAEPRPILEAKLPASARVSLLHQAHLQRHILHVCYAPIIHRGKVHVIEDLPELNNVELVVDLQPEVVHAINRTEQTITFKSLGDGRTSIHIPRFSGHIGLVLENTG